MADDTDEVPDWAKVWLDRDVAAWLHLQADKYFGGDINLTLNEMLRIPMAMSAKPDDPWAGITAHRQARSAGEAAVQRQRRSNTG